MKKIVITLVVLFLCVIGLWRLSKNDQYQLMGELITRVETDDKVVALTFDDGPTKHATPKILKILDEENIKATFYLNGRGIAKNPEAAKLIVAAGHEIGNHSYSHNRMVFKSLSFIEEEIENTNRLIRDVGYTGEIYFRPPYGRKLFLLPYYLDKHEITTITWDVEPESILDIDATPDELTDYTLAHVKAGSIILMHVMFKSRTNSMAAVPTIIQQLKAKDYRFLTVSELITHGKNASVKKL